MERSIQWHSTLKHLFRSLTKRILWSGHSQNYYNTVKCFLPFTINTIKSIPTQDVECGIKIDSYLLKCNIVPANPSVFWVVYKFYIKNQNRPNMSSQGVLANMSFSEGLLLQHSLINTAINSNVQLSNGKRTFLATKCYSQNASCIKS